MNSYIADVDIQDNSQDYWQVSNEYDDRVFKETTYPLRSVSVEDQIYEPKVSPLPYANNLIAKNRLSTPLTIEFKNKDREIIAKEEHYYSNFENILALEKINFINRDGTITDSEIITKRDTQGRILEFKNKNGVFVTRFYGYDDKYLIVEVVNSTYSNMLLKLQNLQTPFNQSTHANKDDIHTMMSELREVMPEAQITSYTHNPLIGVTSITDPRGNVIYYEYDDFNRLKNIKDKYGKILSENQYYYKQ